METKKDLILKGDSILKTVTEYFEFIHKESKKFNIEDRFKIYIEEYGTNIEANFELLYEIINYNKHKMSNDELEQYLEDHWWILNRLT